jgi:hypothetical protein
MTLIRRSYTANMIPPLNINLARRGVVPPQSRKAPSRRIIWYQRSLTETHIDKAMRATSVSELGSNRLHPRFDVVQRHSCI